MSIDKHSLGQETSKDGQTDISTQVDKSAIATFASPFLKKQLYYSSSKARKGTWNRAAGQWEGGLWCSLTGHRAPPESSVFRAKSSKMGASHVPYKPEVSSLLTMTAAFEVGGTVPQGGWSLICLCPAAAPTWCRHN